MSDQPSARGLAGLRPVPALRSMPPSRAAGAVLLLAAVAAPLWLTDFWLQAGLFAMAAVVGAIGLTLLVGVAGQLSLGHAFFLGVGAYTYTLLAGTQEDEMAGFGLPPVLALVAAAAVSGAAGAAFSPIAGRLRGIYLGLASLGLVFLGRHVWLNAEDVTGGYNGRTVEAFAVPGFSFSDEDPDYLAILGTPFGELHRLWYLFLAIALASAFFGRGIKNGRAGRAMAGVRDGETAAASVGIQIARVKATAFTVSSVYAGVAGALTALAFGRIAPDSFALLVSIDYLVMIVIGGAGSIAGASAGAVFVSVLPLLLVQYSASLPFLSAPGSGGLDAATLSRFVYGVAIVAVLVFLRGGLAGALRRAGARTERAGGPSRSTRPAERSSLKETIP
ncbi:branched-chain amino acid ABC transporter permease [Actinomadura welshii]